MTRKMMKNSGRTASGETLSPQTIRDHKVRFLRTLGYIEAHAGEKPSVKQLAEIACLSPYHFHRRFAYYMGDTVCDYLRKRRLLEAADTLKQSKARAIDVALSIGYETPEAFCRAFKRLFKTTPSGFKKAAAAGSSRSPSAFVLKPCPQRTIPPNSGRKAFWELSRMADQIKLHQVVSVWISVFPDMCSDKPSESAAAACHKVVMGNVPYVVCSPAPPVKLQVSTSGAHAVLRHDKTCVAYKRAETIVPALPDKPPGHLAHLPIHSRSLLFYPDTF